MNYIKILALISLVHYRCFAWFWTRLGGGCPRERGDRVAATARNIDSLVGLKERYGKNVLTLELDVTRFRTSAVFQ